MKNKYTVFWSMKTYYSSYIISIMCLTCYTLKTTTLKNVSECVRVCLYIHAFMYIIEAV